MAAIIAKMPILPIVDGKQKLIARGKYTRSVRRYTDEIVCVYDGHGK